MTVYIFQTYLNCTPTEHEFYLHVHYAPISHVVMTLLSPINILLQTLIMPMGEELTMKKRP